MIDKKAVMKRLKQRFGDARGLLAHQILTFSMSGQPCDVTFFKRKPALNGKIDQKLSLALMYGAGPKKLQEMLDNISLSDGQVVSFSEIWVILPMPERGFSPEQLAEVDLSHRGEKFGPNGETIREMIRDTYHCKSKDEEDKFLRRYLAS